jgi:hypothetical protein
LSTRSGTRFRSRIQSHTSTLLLSSAKKHRPKISTFAFLLLPASVAKYSAKWPAQREYRSQLYSKSSVLMLIPTDTATHGQNLAVLTGASRALPARPRRSTEAVPASGEKYCCSPDPPISCCASFPLRPNRVDASKIPRLGRSRPQRRYRAKRTPSAFCDVPLSVAPCHSLRTPCPCAVIRHRTLTGLKAFLTSLGQVLLSDSMRTILFANNGWPTIRQLTVFCTFQIHPTSAPLPVHAH